jgi:hypothetical protein
MCDDQVFPEAEFIIARRLTVACLFEQFIDVNYNALLGRTRCSYSAIIIFQRSNERRGKRLESSIKRTIKPRRKLPWL